MKKMDIYFAVFNCHVNNAQEKADNWFIDTHGQEIFDMEIKPFLDGGIMSIFQTSPTTWTSAYAKKIQEYVNQ